ncbi:TPA: NusA-like transcription termination signal-binding factor [Candidatus Woesearchaeota archaeon]|nr:NusA-like transcription termination signal-binding factor [Candidatus Woesearchaeota archaeon]
MTKIVYDQDTMQKMTLFEQLTRAKLKDFFDDPVQERLVFIVDKGELWKALGKKSVNVPKLMKAFGRKIKIVEFDDDLCQFIKNMAHPLKINDVSEEGGIVTIKHEDLQTKGLLIGRNAKNLRNLEKNVRRFFEVEEIKVV